MKPLHVSFVIDNLSRAGTESQLLALIRSLDRSRVIPSLVLLDGMSDASQSLEPNNCDVLRLGVTKLFASNAAVAANRLRRAWQNEKPDVVVAYFLDSAYFSLPFAKWCGAKTVRVRNNLGYWTTAKHRWLGRAVRPFVDLVLTNSDDGRAALVEEGHPEKRIVVIENGVDLDRFPQPQPVDLNKPTVRIGCVANLRPVKNIDGLVRAADSVCQQYPQVEFAVAGDGEQRKDLEQLIESRSLTNRFHLLGSCSDVPGFLQSCEIAVLPSHSEGMSNALLEFMAAGRAVLATDVGANRKVLGETGLLVPPRDDNALSAGLMDMLANPEEARHRGLHARQRVERLYSRSAMVERFTSFFQRLANPHVRQAA
ncbi:MAG: glycosyltransferase [Gemmataceae bacterium]